MVLRVRDFDRELWPLIALAGFTVSVFLLGGGSRADIVSLLVLRPLAAAVACLACASVLERRPESGWFPIVFLLLCFAMVAFQLVPLPPSIWRRIPGREVVAVVDDMIGAAGNWRPITLIPSGTWNALLSLSVPIATAALATLATREQRFRMPVIFLGLGGLSVCVGLLQMVGGVNSPFYFYRITSVGSMAGLFANRNHHALYLAALIPMLAVYVSAEVRSIEMFRFRRFIAAVAGLTILAFLLVLGSRAGLVLGMVGLASACFLYKPKPILRPAKRGQRGRRREFVIGGLALLLVGFAAVAASRGASVHRLVTTDTTEIRLSYWREVVPEIATYFPLGSGFGSFVPIFQMDEPLRLVEPSYANHAHNDLLETILTGGGPGLALIFVAVTAWCISNWRVARSGVTGRDLLFHRLGAVILLMIGAASLVDYPLRVPSIASLAAMCSVWMASAQRKRQ